MEKDTVEKAVELANEALVEQMEKNGHKVYEGSGGGQVFIKSVARLATSIMINDAK